MTKYPEADKIQSVISAAKQIVIIQADNPDGDSLASALALEQILGDIGKEVSLYCGVDIPVHLRHIRGWDRVTKELPNKLDASIIVDTSTDTLLEQLDKTGLKMWLRSKPCIVIDHHDVEANITYATIVCNHVAVSTSEVIYELSEQLKWPRNQTTNELIAIAIMSDSLGLVSEGASSRSIHIIADLVDGGVSLASLESARREMMRKPPELVHYKGALLQRVEYYDDNRIAIVSIPWEEIEQYSQAYNPSMLVLDDMRLSEGTDVAIAFKIYSDGKVTAKIRCNFGKGIGNDLAKHFGGGGHPYASGFKIQDGRPYNEIKAETIYIASELLNNLENKHI